MLKRSLTIAFCLLAAQINLNVAFGDDAAWKAVGAPLTTEEARAALAGNSLRGETRRGTKVRLYFTENMDAYRILKSGPAPQEYHLLRNGVLCWRRAERQYCYRIFVDGEEYAFAFLNLDISHKGEILPGDAYGQRIEVDDVPAWTAAIEGLDSNPDELRALRGRNRVLQEYGWDEVARRTSCLLYTSDAADE